MASPHRRVALITLTVLIGGLLAAGIRLVPTFAANAVNADLQVTQEYATGSNASGAATITLTATLYDPMNTIGTRVAWEVEGGPADTDGATVNSPDFACFANAANTCSITLNAAGSGIGLVRAWVDADRNQPPGGTNEADVGEGRLSNRTPFVHQTATPQSDCRDDPSTPDQAEDTPNQTCFADNSGQAPAPEQPGNIPEPDGTDVVQYSFAGAASQLDCDDDTLLNGQDNELNPVGQDQTYICRVTDSKGVGVANINVDGENLSSVDGGTNGFGANDPDSTAGGISPDYDTTNATNPVGSAFCYTDANGVCSGAIDGETEDGPAYVCFWIDPATQTSPNGDSNVAINTPGNPGDGGDCGPNEPVAEAEGNDSTDTVLVQWSRQASVASALDIADPESPAVGYGGTIEFTGTVYDQYGDTFSGGSTIKAEHFVGSSNDRDANTPASPDRTCATGEHFSCTISVSSSTPGSDLLCFWVNDTPAMAGDANNGTCAGESIPDDPTVDTVDVVRATWTTQQAPPPPPTQVAGGQGYVLVGSDGGIFTFGSAQFKGSLGNMTLNQPIIGIAYKPGGTGYWLVAKDGGVFTFGDADFYGSTGNMKLNSPVLGMEATPDGGGYWLYAADGGIFTFGNAKFHGSTGNMKLNSPVVGMAVNSTGTGYWLVAQDGGIFTFNAPFHGSTGNMKLNQPVFDMAPAAGDKGYWLVARDGGVFTFGSGTPFYGSGVGNVTGHVIGMDSTPSGAGYWIADSNGKVVPFGDARSFGDRSGRANNASIIAFATVKPKP